MSSNSVPSSLHVHLGLTEQTLKAIETFEKYHQNISRFHIQSDVISSKESIVQENLNKFLKSLVTKAPDFVPYSCSQFFRFEKEVFVGLNEAKLLAEAIHISKPKYVMFNFSHGVSISAFEYLVSQCGTRTKKNNIDDMKHHERQPKTTEFAFCGKVIRCDHARSLRQVLRISSIQYLSIRNTSISDEGLIVWANELCQNTMLTSLDLSDNKIGVLSAQALANMVCENTCLQSLYIRDNDIGDEGVAALGRALQKNSSLECLDLSNVNCGNEGLLGLADGLIVNNGLKELYLNRNLFGEHDLVGMEALGKSLKINSTLNDLKLYNILRGNDNGLLIGTFLNALDGKTSKLNIDLSYNDAEQFTEASMDRMIHFNAPLLNLDLDSTNFQHSHIEALTQGIQHGTFNIQSLRLGHARMDDDIIINLFNELVQKKDTCSLVKLSLEYVEGVSLVGAQHIVDTLLSTKLQHLYLIEIPIGDNGVQQIAAYLNDTQLTELGLNRVDMGDCGLIALSNALRSNTMLTQLDIYENSNVTGVGRSALLETLKYYNRTLRKILLKWSDDNELDNSIDFYVALNKMRRDMFCGSDFVAISLFKFIFEKYNDKTSLLFWMLTTCPNIYIV